MPASRIFVSYVHIGDERGTEIASQLITDLQSHSVEIVTDDERISDENFMTFLNRELPRCHYLLFIQTPVALKSLRVQTAVNMALTLTGQQNMPRVLRLIAVASEDNDAQPRWKAVRTIDASIDYPRACARLFLELDLIRLDERLDESSPSLIAISRPLSETPAPPSTPLPTIASFSDHGLSPAQPTDFSRLTPIPSGQLSSPGAQPPSAPPPPTSQNAGQVNLYSNAVPAFPPLSAPASIPGNTYYQISGEDDRPVSLNRNGLLKSLAFFPHSLKVFQARFTKTLRTRIPAPPGKLPVEVILDDRPLPLNTSRRMAIRWTSAIVLILVLIAGTTLILVQGRNHADPRTDSTPPTATLAHNTPSPSATKRATSTPRPFPTQGIVMLNPNPQSPIDIYATTTSTLTLNDDLTRNDTTYQWQVNSTGTSGCQFKNAVYDLLASSLNTCVASKSNFSNFVYQIEIKIVQGTTAGILFRANNANHTGYFFQITTDGHFSLWRFDSAKTPPVQVPKTAGLASAIHKGLGQPNVIAVNVAGSHIECYINKIPVIGISDSTYTSGSVGVVAGQGNSSSLSEAFYQYAKVWTLP